ncbi:peptidyl-tRNA hydrolase [Anaplasma platys]|uniref:Peptidyl-tRNA hydrolase n=1 Tax=Anaplasma platys TaxID=949 RepID=A0A858PZF0_9RICK|nr:aminoacyl-tRNA hydrolase [Anaplasma platys]QJC27932.1 peptidyl-tRNA hydrolase [Anaplasma platys]
MLLLIGLGNPGQRYSLTRHNVGFMIIDAVAHFYEFTSFTKKHDSLVSTGEIAPHRVMLMKPQLYMNNSGIAVASATTMLKPERVIVFHDDVALQPGVIRVKLGGSSAGHNGIRSIDSAIGTDYWRVRFGVGRDELCNLSDYVLSEFRNDSAAMSVVDKIAAQIPILLAGDTSKFVATVSLANTSSPKENH